MPRRGGGAIHADLLRVSVRGAGQAARDFSRVQRQIQDDLIAELRDLEKQIQAELADHAPEDTRDTIESIRARFFFRAQRPRFTIQAGAPGHGGDPRSYINVPRFGHRVERIHPVRARALKIHYAGHRSPHLYEYRAWSTGVGHPPPAMMLGAARAGRNLSARGSFRRAYRPKDWVDDAMPQVRALAAASSTRLGRKIEVGGAFR